MFYSVFHIPIIKHAYTHVQSLQIRLKIFTISYFWGLACQAVCSWAVPGQADKTFNVVHGSVVSSRANRAGRCKLIASALPLMVLNTIQEVRLYSNNSQSSQRVSTFEVPLTNANHHGNLNQLSDDENPNKAGVLECG